MQLTYGRVFNESYVNKNYKYIFTNFLDWWYYKLKQLYFRYLVDVEKKCTRTNIGIIVDCGECLDSLDFAHERFYPLLCDDNSQRRKIGMENLIKDVLILTLPEKNLESLFEEVKFFFQIMINDVDVMEILETFLQIHKSWKGPIHNYYNEIVIDFIVLMTMALTFQSTEREKHNNISIIINNLFSQIATIFKEFKLVFFIKVIVNKPYDIDLISPKLLGKFYKVRDGIKLR